MFSWFNRFKADSDYEAKLAEYLARYEQELLAQEQVRLMQFFVAMSDQLFPGDNNAVDRVEKAFYKAMDVVAVN